jgi:hypothetical protein
MDSGALSISDKGPGKGLLRQNRNIRNTSLKALTRQDGEFNLSHIGPTGMFESEMEFQVAGNLLVCSCHPPPRNLMDKSVSFTISLVTYWHHWLIG